MTNPWETAYMADWRRRNKAAQERRGETAQQVGARQDAADYVWQAAHDPRVRQHHQQRCNPFPSGSPFHGAAPRGLQAHALPTRTHDGFPSDAQHLPHVLTGGYDQVLLGEVGGKPRLYARLEVFDKESEGDHKPAAMAFGWIPVEGNP